MKKDGIYSFSKETREMLESLQHPLAAYQFVNDKIKTLLVSDGMCRMAGMAREPLVQLFDTNMYRGTHPDDIARVAELAHRFIITESEYDVTYRTILYGKMEYRYLHVSSKFHTMEDGSRVAFTMYDDVTELIKRESENTNLINAPKAQFLDENMSAMAVVERITKKVLYYNKALVKMLPPRVEYDSGRTFQDFFYHDLKTPDGLAMGIAGLYDSVDIGPARVTEPVTGRKLEVTAISSAWGGVPSYTLFFFESAGERKNTDEEQELRRRRMVFNSIMNSVSSTNLNYYEIGYRAFWIWNLSKDGKLIRDSGHAQIHHHLGETFSYMQYWNFMCERFDGVGDREYAETVTLDALKQMYSEGVAPKARDFTVHNENGQVTMRTEFTLMQSPDDGDLYMKVTEENVTDAVVQKALLSALVRKQFDFILYIDVPSDSCRIINGSTSNASQEELSGPLMGFYRQIAERLGIKDASHGELIAFIEGKCADCDEATFTHKVSENSLKSIFIKVLNRGSRQYFICSSDVTELLKRENENQQRLKQALETAERANQAKSEFVSRISHDIRTPISIISGMTDFALEDIGDAEKLRDDLDKIRTADTFLLSLINDVLDISKIDSGKITLEPAPYPFAAYKESIQNMFVPFCTDKQIAFEMVDRTPFAGSLVIDRIRLNQITLNLLSNAVKYTLPGGKVTFALEVELSETKPGCLTLSFEVADTGIGMSEAFVERMFDPFSQEYDNPMRPKAVTGTGLGLSIVKKMIDLMGGSIAVKSSLGKGTDILCRIECPYVEEETDGAGAPSAHTGGEAPKRPGLTGHLLIVEDNEMNVEIIRRITQSFGLRADAVENGREAVEKFRSSPEGTYDAILMDIQMPIMNGTQATEKIRALSERADAKTVPIIAMTADAFADAVTQGMNAGMNDYLVKPIDVNLLYSTLRKYLGENEEKHRPGR